MKSASFKKLIAITTATIILGGLAPTPAAAQGSNALFLYLSTINDLTRGISGSEKTVEKIFASRRGGYIKTKDNEVAECDINFQRFGPIIPLTNMETTKLAPVPDLPLGTPGALAYDTTIDPTALFSVANLPNTAEIFSVPTHEVGNMLYMNREICLQLKAIRRVQYDMEEKEFVEDVTARKTAAKKIAEHEKAYIDALATGRQISPGLTGTGNVDYSTNAGIGAKSAGGAKAAAPSAGEGQSNVLENLRKERDNAKTEASGVLVDAISQSGNIHKETLAATLEKDLGQGFNSTMSKADFDNYVNGCNGCTRDKFWSNFFEIDADPRNNLEGSYQVAFDQNERVRKEADQDTRDEAIAGDGYLGTRNCTGGYTAKAFCRLWSIVTPGADHQGYRAALASSALHQAEMADSLNQDFVTQDFSTALNKMLDEKNAAAAHDMFSIYEQVNPCLEALGLNLDLGRTSGVGLGTDVNLPIAAIIAALNIPFLNEISLILEAPTSLLNSVLGDLGSLTGEASGLLTDALGSLPIEQIQGAMQSAIDMAGGADGIARIMAAVQIGMDPEERDRFLTELQGAATNEAKAALLAKLSPQARKNLLVALDPGARQAFMNSIPDQAKQAVLNALSPQAAGILECIQSFI